MFRIAWRTMTVAVSLPEEVAALAKSEGGELDRAVTAAVVFYHYERGHLSAGKAAQLLGVARNVFEEMRIGRGIDRPFSSEELERDLSWVRKTQ
jgi:predicted HTH domain antitoxin